MGRNDLHLAGTKDKRAVKEQLIVTRNEHLGELNISDVEFELLYRTDKKLYLGDLHGNEFFIIVKHCKSENVENIKRELEERGGFPNFFGVQRFGIARPNTHLIGRDIVEGDFEGAVMRYLCDNGNEDEWVGEARKNLRDTMDFSRALEEFPRGLNFERMLIEHMLKKGGDYAGALRSLPVTLRTIFVYAYQSYLFNRVVSRRINMGLPLCEPIIGDIVVPLDTFGNPENEFIPVKDFNIDKIGKNIKKKRCAITGAVFGFDSPLAEGVQGNIEREIIGNESDDVDAFLRKFVIYEIPEINSRGLRRAMQVSTKVEINTEDDSTASFSFSLPKGCYATSLLREFIKCSDLRSYG